MKSLFKSLFRASNWVSNAFPLFVIFAHNEVPLYYYWHWHVLLVVNKAKKHVKKLFKKKVCYLVSKLTYSSSFIKVLWAQKVKRHWIMIQSVSWQFPELKKCRTKRLIFLTEKYTKKTLFQLSLHPHSFKLYRYTTIVISQVPQVLLKFKLGKHEQESPFCYMTQQLIMEYKMTSWFSFLAVWKFSCCKTFLINFLSDRPSFENCFGNTL